MKWFLVFFAFLTYHLNFAQETYSFKGKVTAFGKIALSKITISALKSKAKATTNEQGEFEIKLNKKDKLSFQGKGFEHLLKTIKKGKSENQFDLKFLDTDENKEVAVNYGHISESDLAYGMKQIKDDLNTKHQFTDIYEYIRKKVPGVQLVQEGGIKKFQFRGSATSMYGSNAAMVLVNGMQTDDLSMLSPYDVSGVSVLKDAAAAEYGVRGANGVILIDTKVKSK